MSVAPPSAREDPVKRLRHLLGGVSGPVSVKRALATAVVTTLGLVDREDDQRITVSTKALFELLEERTRQNTAEALRVILRSLLEDPVRVSVSREAVIVDVEGEAATRRFTLGEGSVRVVDRAPRGLAHVEDLIEA
ncbi:MAG: hypothetical protein OXF01_08920 [Gemmatimonadetes bacterium]|nr:hypothetical protein [Gemmatimonadota bacterium]